MKKAKVFYISKQISYGLMIVFIMLAVFNLGTAYGETRGYGEGPLEWATKERPFKWDSQKEEPPQDYKVFTAHFNKVHKNIWLALVFLGAVYIFDILINPSEHKLTKVWRYLKSVNLE